MGFGFKVTKPCCCSYLLLSLHSSSSAATLTHPHSHSWKGCVCLPVYTRVCVCVRVCLSRVSSRLGEHEIYLPTCFACLACSDTTTSSPPFSYIYFPTGWWFAPYTLCIILISGLGELGLLSRLLTTLPGRAFPHTPLIPCAFTSTLCISSPLCLLPPTPSNNTHTPAGGH